MRLFPPKKDLFLLALAGIYLLGGIIQATLLLNWDVSWLLHATRRLLAGGTYAMNFPDLNPPLIMYLYIPPVLLNKLTHLNIISSLRLYIFFLSTLSLYSCHILTHKIFSSDILSKIVVLTLAVLFLVFPFYEFGQREHIMLIFTMPYLLLAACRLQGSNVRVSHAILIGIGAGLGFGLKPHFLVTFALVELYYIYCQKNLFAWLRTETLTAITIIGIYTVSIFIFQKDYLSILVPIAIRNYYSGFNTEWTLLLFYPVVIFCEFVMVFFFMQYHQNPYKKLSTILFLALIGYLFCYIVQRNLWYYHLIPAFAIAILLFVLQFALLIAHCRTNKHDLFILSGAGAIIVAFILGYAGFVYRISLIYKEQTSSLISYLYNNMRHQSVYFFATTTTYEFPAIDYSQALPSSKYAFLGWIPGLLKRDKLTPDNTQLIQDRDFYLNSVAEELNTNKPRFVLIDDMKYKGHLEGLQFDYLPYFLKNKNFQAAWKEYHYVNTIQDTLYKFNIYERNNLSLDNQQSINSL